MALMFLNHPLVTPASLPDEVLEGPNRRTLLKGDWFHRLAVGPAKEPSQVTLGMLAKLGAAK